MKSLREIYRIGKGPSSSHTMGPHTAAAQFRQAHPEADAFQVILYGSLAKTGKGHLTDEAVLQALQPVAAEVLFDTETGDLPHPNTMCFEVFREGQLLKTVQVVIEPLCPNESNIVNYVWQGVQICEDVNSPKLRQLADIFHMMMGRESAESILKAGALLKHCHIASYGDRKFPGSDPKTVCRLKPYFDALRAIGYTGGVSCECGWGDKKDLAKNLETALKTLRSL